MVSESDVVAEKLVVTTTVESGSRLQTMQIWARRFPVPVSFDDVLQTDFKRISLTTWFDRADVRADAENELSSLALHVWDD